MSNFIMDILGWKSQCGQYTVSITPVCFDKMLRMARTYYPNEIGTSLIGFYSDDGFEAFVVDITPLPSDSKNTMFSFYRGIKGLRKFLNELWKKSRGKQHYVGEWHSHPNASPVPSPIDNTTQLAIATDRKVNCPENILVIVGGNFFSNPELGVFVYSHKRGRIELFMG